MKMLTTKDKEDIHISYLSALCASVSVSFDSQKHDDDSTDVFVNPKLSHFINLKMSHLPMILNMVDGSFV